MKYSSGGEDALSAALADASSLVSMGVPVFSGRLDKDGNPDGRDNRWKGWQRTRPNSAPIERYRQGEALGAVTGVVFDVLDVDPRNGGMESLATLTEALGDDGPEEYWRVATSSGGRHIYIAPLGIGGKNGFLPGIDLKAAGGFVFLPPSVRPSKAAGNAGVAVGYRALTALRSPTPGDRSGAALRDFITERIASRGEGGGAARSGVSELERMCLDAPDGMQHDALKDLVTELSRSTDDDEYVVYRVMRIVAKMPTYNKRRPWREEDVRGLLYAPDRRPIADASGDELADLMALRDGRPMVAAAVTGLKRLDSVVAEKIRWIWFPYIAVGDASLNDSFAGVGKTLTAIDVAARATRGRGMPCAAEVLAPAMNVLLLAPEDRESVLLARFEAAGGDTSRVFIPAGIEIRRMPGKKGKGKERAYLGGHLITFPAETEQFHKWIKEYNIGLVVVDPIAAFLDPDINSNNDASVRRALEPFVLVLGLEKCAAWLIRHFNKDSKQAASMRGGGSVAFGAVARTHMISGELPDEIDSEATHGIALVKTNNARRKKGVALGYVIEDSEIEADDIGNMVPHVRWVGEIEVGADVLARGEMPARRGPEPTVQPRWLELFDKLFAGETRVPVGEIREAAEEAGLTWDRDTYKKAMLTYGLAAEQEHSRVGKGGVVRWYWTKKPKPRVSGHRGAR